MGCRVTEKGECRRSLGLCIHKQLGGKNIYVQVACARQEKFTPNEGTRGSPSNRDGQVLQHETKQHSQKEKPKAHPSRVNREDHSLRGVTVEKAWDRRFKGRMEVMRCNMEKCLITRLVGGMRALACPSLL